MKPYSGESQSSEPESLDSPVSLIDQSVRKCLKQKGEDHLSSVETQRLHDAINIKVYNYHRKQKEKEIEDFCEGISNSAW